MLSHMAENAPNERAESAEKKKGVNSTVGKLMAKTVVLSGNYDKINALPKEIVHFVRKSCY